MIYETADVSALTESGAAVAASAASVHTGPVLLGGLGPCAPQLSGGLGEQAQQRNRGVGGAAAQSAAPRRGEAVDAPVNTPVPVPTEGDAPRASRPSPALSCPAQGARAQPHAAHAHCAQRSPSPTTAPATLVARRVPFVMGGTRGSQVRWLPRAAGRRDREGGASGPRRSVFRLCSPPPPACSERHTRKSPLSLTTMLYL